MTTFVNNDVASGATIYASDHNEQGSRIAGVLNGNVDSSNLSDSAATTSKIADAAVTTPKLQDGAVTFAKTSGIWWEELGRASLSSPGTTLTTPTFAAKKHLKIIMTGGATGGDLGISTRFNGDASASYDLTIVFRSGTTATYAGYGSLTSFQSSSVIANGGAFQTTFEMINYPSLNKLGDGHAIGTMTNPAVGYAPFLEMYIPKWNSAAQITSVTMLKTSGTGSIAAGSEIIVLGHD